LTNVVHDVAAPQRDVEKEPSRRNALVVFRCDLTASDAKPRNAGLWFRCAALSISVQKTEWSYGKDPYPHPPQGL
jgi:hypothetical protein